ncbi:MAG: hypothetical protein AAFX44_18110 [Pseudomonadota bacterium]
MLTTLAATGDRGPYVSDSEMALVPEHRDEKRKAGTLLLDFVFGCVGAAVGLSTGPHFGFESTSLDLLLCGVVGFVLGFVLFRLVGELVVFLLAALS